MLDIRWSTNSERLDKVVSRDKWYPDYLVFIL